jgi:GT2 family glycosyltransferase
MNRKLKIILRAAKKAVKKVRDLPKKNFYKGYSAPEAIGVAAIYPFKHGVRATMARAKRELLRLGGSSAKHHFPNGLVSGVEEGNIGTWFYQYGRKVTIVIPSYNDFEVLKPAVDSIHRTIERKDLYQIIIVDDYCQPENKERLKTLIDDHTKVIFREKNGGFAKAVNTGLKKVPKDHDAIIFNSDIVAHPHWFENLQYGAYAFGEYEKVGIIGPKLLYPDGRIQSAGSYRNTEAREWFDHYYRFQEANYGPANVPHYVVAATGACLYVKRELMDKIGLIDEGCVFAFDDADWCLRAWEAGYRTLYFPAAVLTHHESATRHKNKEISKQERQAVRYFWSKWGDWFDRRNVRTKDGKIRIIYVLQTLGWSGGIRMAVEHANRLSNRGYAIEIWSLSSSPSVWKTEPEVKMRSFRNYNQLTNALAEEEAIKVATWWETDYPVWLASVTKGIAVNFIQEYETAFYPDDPDAQRVVVSSYRKEFQNMTTATYTLDEILATGLKADLIPCGYDDEVYKSLPNVKREDNVLLGLGRRFFQKNFDFSFRAWKQLGEKRPAFWLYGFESDMKSLDAKIKYFTKPSNEEVNELFNKATVFVQTSRHEGFGLPTLEAMASGTPIICTDYHGNRDFCFNNKNCLIVDHDNDEQLTAAYQKLFNDPKLRERLGKEAKKTAEAYTWDAVVDQLETFYKKVASPEPINPYVQKKYRDKDGKQ